MLTSVSSSKVDTITMFIQGTRDGTAEPVARDQFVRHERGQGYIIFSCSADHVQDWQPYPVDTYSCYMCNHTYKCTVVFFTLLYSYLYL